MGYKCINNYPDINWSKPIYWK